MERSLKDVELRTGDTLRLALALCPDGHNADDLSLFYSHKEEHWVWQIEQSLRRPLDDLETRFYTGRIRGQLVGSIATYEHSGVGILSHVFTEPSWRQRGVASTLLAVLMRDFVARGGKFLTLGTDYQSQSYRIYQRAGFRSLGDHSGTMLWEAQSGSYAEYFQPQNCAPTPIAWHHWPTLCALLAAETGGAYAKHWCSAPWTWFENDFLLIMQQVTRGEAKARVLEAETGSALGFALLSLRSPDCDEWQLDVYSYPGFSHEAPGLLQSLGPLPPRVRCYAPENAESCELLHSAGLQQLARLERRWGRDKSGAMLVLAKP